MFYKLWWFLEVARLLACCGATTNGNQASADNLRHHVACFPIREAYNTKPRDGWITQGLTTHFVIKLKNELGH